jgi:hypothetical protein
MAHHEFPPLTAEAEKVLSAGIKATVSTDNPGGIHTQRVFAAAVIHEAVSLSRQRFNNKFNLQDLELIAQHLHALPPPPPTREQMEEALRSLLDSLDCRPGTKLAQEAATLAAGIAHHCKEQP